MEGTPHSVKQSPGKRGYAAGCRCPDCDPHTSDAPAGLAGYRDGCRCGDCRAGNTEAKRRQREERRLREERETRAAARATLHVVGDGAEVEVVDEWEPTPYTVAEHLQLALNTIPGDDPLTRYRKSHAITLAQPLDDPSAFRSWPGLTRALVAIMLLLVKESGPIDDEGAALAGFLEMVGKRRTGG